MTEPATLAELDAQLNETWRQRTAKRLAIRAALAYRKARDWRLGRTWPGAAALVLVSVSMGMRFGAWAGLLAAGAGFALIDHRL